MSTLLQVGVTVKVRDLDIALVIGHLSLDCMLNPPSLKLLVVFILQGFNQDVSLLGREVPLELRLLHQVQAILDQLTVVLVMLARWL